MIELRPKADLGGGNLGWLKALHHFAIGRHGNPSHLPIGDLIVWNDDEIAPGTGFPSHDHSDVEIITYVREGVITHTDSLGNEGRTNAGDVQVISAGAGITHSEVNFAPVATKLFQIWIRPRQAGGRPRWGSRLFPKSDRAGHFVVLASGYDEDEDALPIRANARVVGATLNAGETVDYQFHGRNGYLVPASGEIRLNGLRVDARDGCAVRDEAAVRIEALQQSEVVLVDVA